jgi:hypothetical protein
VATPTPVIEEYCAGGYVAIDDWTDSIAVAARIRAADPVALGSAIRSVFVERFATPVSSEALLDLLERAGQGRQQSGPDIAERG